MKMLLCIAGAVVGLMNHPSIVFSDEPAAGSTPDEVKRFFDEKGKTVISFIGFSGSGYEDEEAMLAAARAVLTVHSPKKAIVNIGATTEGIGAVYALAKKLGFETTGIVSIQAKKYKAEISPHVDKVFFVEDELWGGFVDNSETLSPTSAALVENSDIVIGIGGGAVGRDELVMAKRLGRVVKFFPAEMDHQKAIEKARKKNLPVPTDFSGPASEVFGK